MENKENEKEPHEDEKNKPVKDLLQDISVMEYMNKMALTQVKESAESRRELRSRALSLFGSSIVGISLIFGFLSKKSIEDLDFFDLIFLATGMILLLFGMFFALLVASPSKYLPFATRINRYLNAKGKELDLEDSKVNIAREDAVILVKQWKENEKENGKMSEYIKISVWLSFFGFVVLFISLVLSVFSAL